MARPIELRVVELLAAHLCHDLIGPISAIGNGVELLADEDPEFMRDALALVGDSAHKANRRLQFYRFAYGFSGGGLAAAPPAAVTEEFFAGTSIACDYGAAAQELPLPQQKLACAMLAAAADGLPRGGRLMLVVDAAGPAVEANGTGAGLASEARAALMLGVAADALTTRTVGCYFAGLLADAQGCRLKLTEQPDGFRMAVAPT